MVTIIKEKKDAEVCRGCVYGRLHTCYEGSGNFSTETLCVHPEQNLGDDFCLLNLYEMKKKGEPALYLYIADGNVFQGSQEERNDYRNRQKYDLQMKGVI